MIDHIARNITVDAHSSISLLILLIQHCVLHGLSYMACLRRSCFSRHLCSGFYRRLLKGYHRCLIMRPHQETPWMQKCKVYACIQSCPIFALEVPSWSSSVLAETMTQVPQRYPGCRVVYPSSLLLLIAWVSSSRVVSLKFSLLRVQAKYCNTVSCSRSVGV
jgi:hypothetical protein